MFSRAENYNQNPLSRGKWYCLAPNYIYPNDQIIPWLISIILCPYKKRLRRNNEKYPVDSLLADLRQKVGHQNKKE
jgi:hypothetical protein